MEKLACSSWGSSCCTRHNQPVIAANGQWSDAFTPSMRFSALILLSFIDQLSFQEKHNHSKWVQQVYCRSSRSFHIARCLIILLRLHPPNFVFFCLVFLFYSSNSCDELVSKYNCGFLTETGGCNTMFANVNISLTVASHCSSSKAIRKLYILFNS